MTFQDYSLPTAWCRHIYRLQVQQATCMRLSIQQKRNSAVLTLCFAVIVLQFVTAMYSFPLLNEETGKIVLECWQKVQDYK